MQLFSSLIENRAFSKKVDYWCVNLAPASVVPRSLRRSNIMIEVHLLRSLRLSGCAHSQFTIKTHPLLHCEAHDKTNCWESPPAPLPCCLFSSQASRCAINPPQSISLFPNGEKKMMAPSNMVYVTITAVWADRPATTSHRPNVRFCSVASACRRTLHHT